MDQKLINMLNQLSFNETIDLLKEASLFISQAGINLLQPYDKDLVNNLLSNAPKFSVLIETIKSDNSKDQNLKENYLNAIENRFGNEPSGANIIEIFNLIWELHN